MARRLLFPAFLAIFVSVLPCAAAFGAAEAGALFIVSFVGLLVFWSLIFCLFFVGAIFWLWMFIDCLKREDYGSVNDKIVWVIVLLFASVLGAVLYYLLVRRALAAGHVKKKVARRLRGKRRRARS